MASDSLNSATQNILPPKERLDSLIKLFGEASYREYYRAKTHAGRCYILMKLPKGIQSASEEITNYQGPKNELPFLNVAHYFLSREIPVPKVLGTDLANGVILLQDLGDKTMEKLLADSNETMRLFFYKQAIDLLLQMQQAGAARPDPQCIAFQRSFDLKLLTWEFDHFLEYGIEDRFKLKIPAEEKSKMQELGMELMRPIADIPYGLTHRDFQSRNLMLYGYQFHLIDFQDALLGPPQYDLVALLRDSYVTLPNQTVDAMVNYYLKGRKRVGLPEVEEPKFIQDFHRITLQRKLKDAGRFQYIATVKGSPNFLVHVPASLGYVKTAFERLPESGVLQKLLAKYLPELSPP